MEKTAYLQTIHYNISYQKTDSSKTKHFLIFVKASKSDTNMAVGKVTLTKHQKVNIDFNTTPTSLGIFHDNIQNVLSNEITAEKLNKFIPQN